MVHYKLDYFPLRARGCYVRYIFHQAGVSFDDRHIKVEEWPKLKPTYPLGALPVLYIDGQPLADSVAICVYLGKQFGLDGSNDLEAAKCQSLGASVESTFASFAVPIVTQIFAGNIEKSAENYKNGMASAIEPHLKLFEKLLTENGGSFFVGSKLTWADLMIAHFHDGLVKTFDSKILDDYPKLKQHSRAIHELPNIKKYVQQRDQKTPMPFMVMIHVLQKHLNLPK